LTLRSVRSDRPIDPVPLYLMRTVDAVMKSLNLPYFIVGATARDILLTHVFGLATGLATRDLDIGIAVRDWDEFEEVIAKLVEDAEFVRDTKIVHRLHRGEYPLDIVPFQGVESPEHTIAWPSDLETAMNVAGYQESFEAAETVQVETGLVVRVVSLPGLAVLKLFAWADRGLGNAKDAVDLATLLRSYANPGNEDRLYSTELDTFEVVDYKLELAGARLLGRDARHVTTESTRSQVLGLLGDPAQRERLETHMARVWSRLEDASSGLLPRPLTLAKIRSGDYRPCSRNPLTAQGLSFLHRIKTAAAA
jgi:predicted nucleotidyltransferase